MALPSSWLPVQQLADAHGDLVIEAQAGAAGVEAAGGIGAEGGEAAEEVPVDPQDHPFAAAGLLLGLVPVPRGDQQDVAVGHVVGMALHPVVQGAGPDQQHLKKIMAVGCFLAGVVLPGPEKLIAPAALRGGGEAHGHSPFCDFTTICWQFADFLIFFLAYSNKYNVSSNFYNEEWQKVCYYV